MHSRFDMTEIRRLKGTALQSSNVTQPVELAGSTSATADSDIELLSCQLNQEKMRGQRGRPPV